MLELLAESSNLISGFFQDIFIECESEKSTIFGVEKSSPRGSWEGKSVRRTSSFARIFLISFGEAFSGGGYGVFDIVEDFSLDKGDKGIESLRE
jgi:hypothetical protein